ncbi:MAG: serine/threonine protein kinase [Cyanobacteria bacterium SZAS TMP-1]|nr:serine/threonine protein kinase [Cyanobacteria bacterium SZAS TMP-1]
MKLCLHCNTHFQGDFEQCPDDGSKLVVVPEDPVIGKVLGDKYRVLCPVGKGSMGVVYKAIQESTGREMAVKLLHHFLGTNSDSVKRFHREARAVSRLSHPNIIRLYDFGVMDEGQPYIVTELLKGVTLSDVLRRRGYLTLKQALPLMDQVCAAIGEAHRSRVIHRDLKPENIVLEDVDLDGDLEAEDLIKKNAIRVLDFGVAKMWSDSGASSASLTLEGKVCGSPAYMSPEQCRGVDVDYRTDIYSMGVVFFETLTGKRPFSADDLMALMLMHVNNKAPSLGSVQPEVTFSPELNDVIMKAMAKNPNERQQSAEELWEDVQATSRGRQKTVVVKPPDNWIPFQGKGSLGYKPEKEDPAVETGDGYSSLANPNNILDWTLEAPPPEVNNRSNRRHKLWMVARASALGVLLVVGVNMFAKIYRNNEEAKQASILISRGKCEEGVSVLERMKNDKTLSSEYDTILDDAYLEMAKSYGSNRNYGRAVEVLKKVSPKSRNYSQAQKLIARWGPRVRY